MYIGNEILPSYMDYFKSHEISTPSWTNQYMWMLPKYLLDWERYVRSAQEGSLSFRIRKITPNRHLTYSSLLPFALILKDPNMYGSKWGIRPFYMENICLGRCLYIYSFKTSFLCVDPKCLSLELLVFGHFLIAKACSAQILHWHHSIWAKKTLGVWEKKIWMFRDLIVGVVIGVGSKELQSKGVSNSQTSCFFYCSQRIHGTDIFTYMDGWFIW